MKVRIPLIFGLVIVVVFVSLIVWVFRSNPAPAEIVSAVRPLSALPTDQLNDQLFKNLSDRQIHGNLPVDPLPPQTTRLDPFSS